MFSFDYLKLKNWLEFKEFSVVDGEYIEDMRCDNSGCIVLIEGLFDIVILEPIFKEKNGKIEELKFEHKKVIQAIGPNSNIVEVTKEYIYTRDSSFEISVYPREGKNDKKIYQFNSQKSILKSPTSLLNVGNHTFFMSLLNSPDNQLVEIERGPTRIATNNGIDWKRIDEVKLLLSPKSTTSIGLGQFVKVQSQEIYDYSGKHKTEI